MQISGRQILGILALLVPSVTCLAPASSRAAEGTCSGATCGTNSPFINQFPFNGLDGSLIQVTQGNSACSLASNVRWTLGIELIAQDSRQADAPPPHFRGYQLVVRDQDGNKYAPCNGHRIAGIHFVIRARYLHFFSRSYYFVIEQVSKMKVTRRISGSPPEVELRYGYLITQQMVPGASLCTHSLRVTVPQGKGYARIQVSGDSHDIFDVHPTMMREYAVILPGPIYNERGDVIVSKADRFNIACADNALAQTDLSGLVRPEDPPEDRTAAVHMFTAKFRAGESSTEPGTPIVWRKGAVHSSDNPQDDEQVIEARWDTTRATCVSHSRLWMQDRVISVSAGFAGAPDPEARYVATLRDPGVVACEHCDPGAPCDTALTSFAVHHIDHGRGAPSLSSVTTPGTP
jgi:hypothetical protein